MVLEIAERHRIVYLHVSEPVRAGDGSSQLAWALLDACEEIEQREEPPAGVALTCGGDAFWLKSMGGAEDCDAVGEEWAWATAALARLAPPTVAAIGGDAIGPGWELALACDLRLAAEHARLGSPEVRWGRMPAAGGTQRLTRLVGQGTALRLLLLGEIIQAQTALELGLIQRVSALEHLDEALEQNLGSLRRAAPIALQYTKEAVNWGAQLTLEDGLRLEADLAALLQTTHDRAEGISAFLERREPRFEAR